MKDPKTPRFPFPSLALGLVALPLSTCGSQTPPAGRLPNIVFLMADDMGYGDPRSFNADSKIPTPSMDELAARGIRFTDAHAGSAVCTPTRYGVVTGRYAWRTRLQKGVLSGYSPALIDPHRMTVASMLRQHGYHTAVVGKWHLGLGWVTTSEPDSSQEIDTSAAFQGSHEFARPPGMEIDYNEPVTNGRQPLALIIRTSFRRHSTWLPTSTWKTTVAKGRRWSMNRGGRRTRLLAPGRSERGVRLL